MLRALDRWLWPYLTRSRYRPPTGTTHVLLAICDHFEPFHHSDKEGALRRMKHWRKLFPELVEPFRDTCGHPPKHTFFYPVEQYDREVVGELANICRETGSETEIHLHHDGDTAASLAEKLETGKTALSDHGLLSRDGNGQTVYGFIHGDWALDHSHPSGRHCGVPDELGVLKRTGCYADFTLPSAPSPTQTRTINSLYYAQDSPAPKSHNTGTPVRAGATPTSDLREEENRLLLVQGPLGLNWQRRKFGLIPRIENADITGANPPTPLRFGLWRSLGIHVSGRPDVVFIKLHTHGAIERNSSALLGRPMQRFHRYLQEIQSDENRTAVHYVTAREMVNILHALEDGKKGPVGDYRDYLFRPNSNGDHTGS